MSEPATTGDQLQETVEYYVDWYRRDPVDFDDMAAQVEAVLPDQLAARRARHAFDTVRDIAEGKHI